MPLSKAQRLKSGYGAGRMWSMEMWKMVSGDESGSGSGAVRTGQEVAI